MNEPVCYETNQKHLLSPEPGDYWNEMLVPQLLVLARNPRGVLVITQVVAVDDGWMWDFDTAHTITLDELRKHVKHSFCYPRFHEKAVGWWKEHLGIASAALEPASS